MNFLNFKDIKLGKEFKKNGYVIINVKKLDSLYYLQDKIIKSTQLKVSKKKINKINFLNNFHKKIKIKNLNTTRLNIMKRINNDKRFKYNIYDISKELLNSLVGNELVMQKRINLSIQLPNDPSSLLPVHSDVWSGDSPYEVVVWLPLVDCYKTKSMFILPPKSNLKLNRNFNKFYGKSSEKIFNFIKKDIKWIKINKGELLIFNQALPHGNRINKESTTRWSMNCRFKSLFSPYGDKKIGEFFVPITTKVASRIGMEYQSPSQYKYEK